MPRCSAQEIHSGATAVHSSRRHRALSQLRRHLGTSGSWGPPKGHAEAPPGARSYSTRSRSFGVGRAAKSEAWRAIWRAETAAAKESSVSDTFARDSRSPGPPHASRYRRLAPGSLLGTGPACDDPAILPSHARHWVSGRAGKNPRHPHRLLHSSSARRRPSSIARMTGRGSRPTRLSRSPLSIVCNWVTLTTDSRWSPPLLAGMSTLPGIWTHLRLDVTLTTETVRISERFR